VSDAMTGNGTSQTDLYVITLCTASLPMVLRVPFVHELVGFSVFRSRTVQDGRERYRLCVGYFDSASRAHAALAIVRRHYPKAWISCAPLADLGSLDDTLSTAFQMIHRATARVVETAECPAPEVAATALLAVPAPTASPTQRYVVQLDWSAARVPSTEIPRLAILRAYHLYRGRVYRDEGEHHTLRLGFFSNVHSARQVAEYVRVHFPRVSVVPVSNREHERALGILARQAAPASGVAALSSISPGGEAGARAVSVTPNLATQATRTAAAPGHPALRAGGELHAWLAAGRMDSERAAIDGSTGVAPEQLTVPAPPSRRIRSW